MAANDNLDLILRRHREISARLTEGVSGAEYSALSRELSDLEPIVSAIGAYRAKEKERADLGAMLADPDLDAEIRAMAGAEFAVAEMEAGEMEKAIRIALLPKDAADEGDAILEVRAGTGGDEAALFAGDLFRMYVKYSELKRWKVEVLSMSEGTAGGYKEIVAEISGRDVFARLRFESGVHRVQRVPATETQGRIHTSAATVAVLPVAEEARFRHQRGRPQDRHHARGGAGGQHVNKTESAMRITQHPDEVVVTCQDDRSITTTTRRSRSCGRASSTPATRRCTPNGPSTAAPTSAPATALSASAPTISPETGSPSIASISRSIRSSGSWRARGSTRSSTL